MSNPSAKIKIIKDQWFTVVGNKLIFGNSSLDKGFHYTLSFGNRSGYFDLHLTNDRSEHYTIVEISHQNVFQILPNLFLRIKESVFDFAVFDESQLNREDSILYKVEQLSDITSELRFLTKKNKVIIDKDSFEFKSLVDKLIEKQTVKKVELDELKSEAQFMGFVQSKTENYFIVKNSFFGDQVYKLNNINLDINSIFETILGKEIYDSLLAKIKEGLLYLKE